MSPIAALPAVILEPIVRLALHEDLYPVGDITSAAALTVDTPLRAAIRSREPGVIAGVDAALLAAHLVDSAIEAKILCGDGAVVDGGETVLELSGKAQALLAAERTMLNFIGHLSGIATLTRAYVQAVAASRAKVTCTRKTTPGLRTLEKRAVQLGGGVNHRYSLSDAILIKDNHIAAAGGVHAALARARAAAGHMRVIEIEVDSLEQLREALPLEPHCVLLDNMSLEELREAVSIGAGRVILEASGNVQLSAVGAIAATGVDYISIGALTHSSRRLDVGLDAV